MYLVSKLLDCIGEFRLIGLGCVIFDCHGLVLKRDFQILDTFFKCNVLIHLLHTALAMEMDLEGHSTDILGFLVVGS